PRLLNWVAEAELHVERVAWVVWIFEHPIPVEDVPVCIREDHVQHAGRSRYGTTAIIVSSARRPTDRPAVAKPRRRLAPAIQTPVNGSGSQERLLRAFGQAVGYIGREGLETAEVLVTNPEDDRPGVVPGSNAVVVPLPSAGFAELESDLGLGNRTPLVVF